MDWIKEKTVTYCSLIRKDAVPLVDAFNLSDYIINSPFGRFDGNVYEHYFQQVNRAHPPGRPHPYFESEVPYLRRRLLFDLSFRSNPCLPANSEMKRFLNSMKMIKLLLLLSNKVSLFRLLFVTRISSSWTKFVLLKTPRQDSRP